MDYNILLGLLISYSITYFILQSVLPRKQKKFKVIKRTFRLSLYTLLTHTLLTFIFLFNILSPKNILVLLIYLVIHTVVDEVLEQAYIKGKNSSSAIYLFLADKAIRLLLIIISTYLLKTNLPKHATFAAINKFFESIIGLFPTQLTYQNRLLVAVFLFIIALWGAGKFIALIIESINKSGENKSPEILKAGFLIGILERFFIICSIVFGMPQVIGFVLAAKSVARLSKLNDDYFVEIFIIGNFMSFVIAIIVGAVIKNLDLFPYLIKTIE